LISSTTETSFLRHQTVETLRYGTSISKHSPLDPSTTTNLGISRAQEKQMRCKSGAQIQDGGNCSSTVGHNLLTSNRIKEYLLLLKMLKENL
jgi:hypothetical protein